MCVKKIIFIDKLKFQKYDNLSKIIFEFARQAF